MMYFIQSDSTDPYYNLALEQVVFDRFDRAHSYFMLWQNDNTVVVGKHQNTAAEIDTEFVAAHGVNVVRRLSGGGAVYHDLGNVNFTFITDSRDGSFDFAAFCRPVLSALSALGVQAEASGRNDMVIDGKKFSGNAQYIKQERVMHHGTILFDSDLSVVAKALRVSADKIASKGVKSVRARVTNIRPHLKNDMTVHGFIAALRDFIIRENSAQPYTLNTDERAAVSELRERVYSRWEWNYGASPPYSIKKARRVEGCGNVEAFMDIERGVIRGIAFYGDYFGNGDSRELAARLVGCRLEEQSLRAALAGAEIGFYFSNLDTDGLLAIILQ